MTAQTADLCRKLIRDGYLILPGGDRVTIDWPGKGAGSLPIPASDLEVSSGKEVAPSPTGEQQPDSDLGSVDHGDSIGNRGGDDDASGDGSKLAELPGERGEAGVEPVSSQQSAVSTLGEQQAEKPVILNTHRTSARLSQPPESALFVAPSSLPTGGQEANCPPVGNFEKATLLTSEQDADCPPVGKTAKPRKKRQLFDLPTGGQDELKPLMPTLPTGHWWECPADDRGFKVKLRWRGGQPPHSHVFARVGKWEFQSWKEKEKDECNWIIADRLRSELRAKGKLDIARRIGLVAGNN